jgi:microcystin-dependent protein
MSITSFAPAFARSCRSSTLCACLATRISTDAPAFTNLTSAFSSTNVFLGVTITLSNNIAVSNPSEIVPRQQLLSVPFALQAQQAQQAQQALQAQAALSLSGNLASALCPPGSIMAFGGTNIPTGWLLCDGSPVSNLQYPQLFSAVGTSWGSGTQGSTNNFNLPDLRGLFLRGVDSTGINDPDFQSRTNAAGVQNANVGSLHADMFKSHTHPAADSGPTGAIGSGTLHVLETPPFSLSTSPLIGYAGGNETRPKNAYVNYIIKY